MPAMKRPVTLNRRRFIAAAVAVPAAGCGVRKTSGRFLTETEMRALTAICDQIIPPDQDPGGAWAGVAHYIDRQLAGKFSQHRAAYRAGLAEADRRAGGSFASLERDQQLDLLRQMEQDKPSSFFALVVTHSMQGFYGNPRHGGNRDWCSWRMLGVPASPVRGRDSYDFTKGGGA